MPNDLRGEIEINLGGQTYLMRPSFQVMREIEMLTRMDINPLGKKFSLAQQGIQDVTAVLYAGIRGGGNTKLKYDEVGEMVYRKGFAKANKYALDFMAALMRGDEEDLAEAKKEDLPKVSAE